MNPPNNPTDAPILSAKAQPSESSFVAVFRLWREGICVFGRFLWFMFLLGIAMLPFNLIALLISPKKRAVFENGEFHAPAAIVLALIIIYLPFACVFAARRSEQLRGKP
jgi:hypothetical protein